MLREKKIRFTQPCFLNDPFEFTPGMPNVYGHHQTWVGNRRATTFGEKARQCGVLSLPQKNNSIPMWAHYAASHAGFAIGFDTGSSFLRKAIEDRKLHPVRYLPERVSLTGLENPDAILVTKSTEWHYEEEWRWIECCSPDEYDEVRSAPNGEVLYLRSIPPQCIQEVVLGYRIEPCLAELIRAPQVNRRLQTPESVHCDSRQEPL